MPSRSSLPPLAPGRGRRPTLLLLTLLLGVAATGFGPPGITASSGGAAPVYADQVPLAQRLSPPALGAAAAAVLDDASGQLLYGKDERRHLPMASTTKIMTALLAVERGRLSDVVTVDVDAAALGDSSLMGLTPGERLTLQDLLYGLLLPSGNDAALAIARRIAGSDAAFVALMNQRAAELGLADTHYANPHGLDAPDHYTSAADLARLTRVALRNPTFAQIVATQKKTIQGRATYQLQNTNPLLGRPDVEGVKTGHTDAAGACLVAAFRRTGHRVITVVLNSPDYGAESVALADYAYSAYAWPSLALPESPLALGAGGTAPAVTPASPPALALPGWQVPLLQSEIDLGARQARFTVAGRVVATIPIGAPD